MQMECETEKVDVDEAEPRMSRKKEAFERRRASQSGRRGQRAPCEFPSAQLAGPGSFLGDSTRANKLRSDQMAEILESSNVLIYAEQTGKKLLLEFWNPGDFGNFWRLLGEGGRGAPGLKLEASHHPIWGSGAQQGLGLVRGKQDGTYK